MVKMSVIVSFFKLPVKDKIVILEALFWLILIRLMIWIFPFDLVQKRVQKITSHYTSDNKHIVSLPRLRLIMGMAARYVPRATCLVQALAGYILFSRYGHIIFIKIGVSNENGEFEAHAWLEKDGNVVLGESKKNFKTILDID